MLLFIPPIILAAIATRFDLRSRTIPDTIPLLLLAWAVLAWAFNFSPISIIELVVGVGAGLLVGAFFFWLGALGGGDVKFLAALGGCFGAPLLGLTLFFVAVAGFAFALVAYVRKKREIAFMPAIFLGMIICWCVVPGGFDLP